MDIPNDIVFPLLAFISLWIGIFQVWESFEAERERQRIITRSRTVARTFAGNLKEAPDDEQGGYLPELDVAYHYYQQGRLRKGKLLAPGKVRLSDSQAWELVNYLQQEVNFLVHIDPTGKSRPCLTPGPVLISWWYLIMLVIFVALSSLLIRFTGNYLYVFILLTVYQRLVKSRFEDFYSDGLVHWLKPARKMEARPQVQSKVEEAMELPPIVRSKEKLKS